MPMVLVNPVAVPKGIVCTCAEPTYDEVGCIKCFEKGLTAIENPESLSETASVDDLSLETPPSEPADGAADKYAKGVFCTCKDSEYDEIGCDSCIEKAFQAMKH